MLVKAVLANAKSSTVFRTDQLANVADESEAHAANAKFPIEVTVAGTINDAIPEL